MSNWRLLKLETSNAYRNMAIDEAILTARTKGLVPDTLRIYRWKPSAVSVGKFQNVKNEVQLDNCRAQAVDIVRRITGGGTVYHDCEGEITYSVVVDKQELGSSEIGEIYAKLYSGLAEALRLLGVEADFNEGSLKACPNLTVKGKKISGSAQTHKAGVVLQHGTLLLNVDLDKMFALLRIPWAKTYMEIVGIAAGKMTSISMELGRRVSADEVTEALKEGISQALNVNLAEAEMTPYEQELSDKLGKEKYGRDEWNFLGQTALA